VAGFQTFFVFLDARKGGDGLATRSWRRPRTMVWRQQQQQQHRELTQPVVTLAIESVSEMHDACEIQFYYTWKICVLYMFSYTCSRGPLSWQQSERHVQNVVIACILLRLRVWIS
jgi:hypothetical protein